LDEHLWRWMSTIATSRAALTGQRGGAREQGGFEGRG
jgi:hypothetical protein